jgi:hypothetical protein
MSYLERVSLRGRLSEAEKEVETPNSTATDVSFSLEVTLGRIGILSCWTPSKTRELRLLCLLSGERQVFLLLSLFVGNLFWVRLGLCCKGPL